jgi:single-strand DNA-binding protein
MPISVNVVVLIGNLTKDPELRHTQGGVAVCDLRVAVNGSEKIQGEWTERADFFDVTVWGNQAEACAQYLSKGSKVGVDGKLRYEEWEDRDSGAKRSRVKVVAGNVQFLSGAGSGDGQSSRPADDDDWRGATPRQTDDDIGF